MYLHDVICNCNITIVICICMMMQIDCVASKLNSNNFIRLVSKYFRFYFN